MPGSLYLVSTPIGNLEDITLRALRVLKTVRLIAAEDTRRTGILLHHFGIPTPTTSFHEHNERDKLPALLGRLEAGDDLALVSDAGTPLISDPGHRLIAAAIDAGYPVVAVPGVSAVLAALVSSGFTASPFTFLGFPPIKANDRKRWLQDLARETRTTVFFEAPHRIEATLKGLSEYLGTRQICVCRELTKLHEEILRGSPIDIIGYSPKARGEFTIVVSPLPLEQGTEVAATDTEIWQVFCGLTKNAALSRRAALAATAKRFGVSTKQAYAAVERMKRTAAVAAQGPRGSA